MTQIKTVIRSLERTTEFDEEINRLLKDGWKLIARGMKSWIGEPSEAFNFAPNTVLYAELEREQDDFEEITL